MVDPEIARLRASRAGNARWAAERDRAAATAKMRQGFLAKLQAEARENLGPAATDDQIAKAVTNALNSHMARMRLNSILARRKAAQARQDAITDAILGLDPADGEATAS
jgi:hypothetical protein